jgi:hypothetical protein
MGRKQQLISHPRYGLVLQWIKESQRTQKKAGWPGLPIGQIPLVCKPYLDAILEDGGAYLASRPARVNPDRIATFVVLTDMGEHEWASLVELGPEEFARQFDQAGRDAVALKPLADAAFGE